MDAELADAHVLALLTPDDRQRLAAIASKVSYADGDRLFDIGEDAEGCWIIESGHVALDIAVPGRGNVVVQTAGPGDIVGWSWLVPPYQWQFGAAAVGATSAWLLDTGALRAMAQADPAFGYSLLLTLFQALLSRLQATRARLLNLYENPAATRRVEP